MLIECVIGVDGAVGIVCVVGVLWMYIWGKIVDDVRLRFLMKSFDGVFVSFEPSLYGVKWFFNEDLNVWVEYVMMLRG